MPGKLSKALRLIDEANQKDPTLIDVDGESLPAEYVYGSRMSSILHEYLKDPDPYLQIAARGQHIERWKTPRSEFDEGKKGYFQWRNQLKTFHAERVREIMEHVGYGEIACDRVSDLIRKKGLAHDLEVQKLEDVIVIVFLRYYAEDFLEKHPREKGLDIMAKTARKMSATGILQANVQPLPPQVKQLLEEALKQI